MEQQHIETLHHHLQERALCIPLICWLWILILILMNSVMINITSRDSRLMLSLFYAQKNCKIQPCKLDEDFKLCQLANMVHMSRQAVCSQPTGSGPRESRPDGKRCHRACRWWRRRGKKVRKGRYVLESREIRRESERTGGRRSRQGLGFNSCVAPSFCAGSLFQASRGSSEAVGQRERMGDNRSGYSD
jgi:hypothetical protein